MVTGRRRSFSRRACDHGGSDLIGKQTTHAGVAEDYNVAILGIQFAESPNGARAALHAISPMSEGDILLIAETMANVEIFARGENLLILEGMKEMPRTGRRCLHL